VGAAHARLVHPSSRSVGAPAAKSSKVKPAACAFSSRSIRRDRGLLANSASRFARRATSLLPSDEQTLGWSAL
jgi:hypothetical protein